MCYLLYLSYFREKYTFLKINVTFYPFKSLYYYKGFERKKYMVINKFESQYYNLDTKERIKNELKKLKYNFSYKGTQYLIETIYILSNIKDNSSYCLEKDIYPVVAKMYDKSVNNIKCNITNATDRMYYDCDEKELMIYLNQYQYSKPGTRKIISAVLSCIKKN